ncbi:unnamed protein product [Dovyalis caffra]|uniref:Uncharacterized protein n=1 Tax=Dovyalis caffra TaxID=77055 RepID=A0AAV1SRB4_9ROSI|nr:unnamed protein product [Dovyalis caffra]
MATSESLIELLATERGNLDDLVHVDDYQFTDCPKLDYGFLLFAWTLEKKTLQKITFLVE